MSGWIGKRGEKQNSDDEGQFLGIYGVFETAIVPSWDVHLGGTCRDPARPGSHLAMLYFSLVRVGVRIEGKVPDTPSRPFIPIYPPGQSSDLAGARAISCTQRLNEPYN